MIFLFLAHIFCADHSKYRTCDQSPFCKRDRFVEKQSWTLNPKSVKISGKDFTAEIKDDVYNTILNFRVNFLECGASHFRIEPSTPEKFRYNAIEDNHIINQNELKATKIFTQNVENDKVTLKSDFQTIVIQFSPFAVFVEDKDGKRRLAFNADNNAVFETGRDKDKYPELFQSYNWGGHTDNFKNGPTSVAMDIDFLSPKTRISGLPEHTLPLTLANTVGVSDPIRLFATDINSFEVDSVMAMYSGIPFIFAHSLDGYDGVFWCNPSETWVDISDIPNEGKRTRLMSEGGYIDIFVACSKHPSDISNTFTTLTGRPQLVPLFGLALHQCRWGYMTSDEVLEVDHKLDDVLTPHDVLWLDLDYSDNRKYFIFHPSNFRDPLKLLDDLDKNKRQLVALIDPHLRAEDSYHIYAEAKKKGYFIKNSDGTTDFHGNCWPGRSAWPDFLMPEVRQWWSGLFDFSKFTQSRSNLYTWIDMNEISVFDSVDQTAPKDLVHFNNIEEREVHNIYGLLMSSATFDGLRNREKDHNKRPFILTRSFFAGSQQYAVHWTGDNAASFAHLANSLQMVLSNGLGFQVYSGADVGGFFDNADEKLLSRWYQVAAWTYSFFRIHCHHLSNYREIYNLHGQYFEAARDAVIDRYLLLPYWYLTARESNLTGAPIVRPLWWLFGSQEKFIDVDSMVMIGDSLLCAPFLKDSEEDEDVSLPASELWYHYHDLKQVQPGAETVHVPFNGGRTAVFIRGGSIIPTKSRVRKSSPLMFYDPYRLTIALDSNGQAEGELYVDDGESFDFVKGAFIHKKLTFDGKVLKATDKFTPPTGDFLNKYDVPIEQIRITGLSKKPTGVFTIKPDQNKANIDFDFNDGILTIHRPQVLVRENFSVELEF